MCESNRRKSHTTQQSHHPTETNTIVTRTKIATQKTRKNTFVVEAISLALSFSTFVALTTTIPDLEVTSFKCAVRAHAFTTHNHQSTHTKNLRLVSSSIASSDCRRLRRGKDKMGTSSNNNKPKCTHTHAQMQKCTNTHTHTRSLHHSLTQIVSTPSELNAPLRRQLCC